MIKSLGDIQPAEHGETKTRKRKKEKALILPKIIMLIFLLSGGLALNYMKKDIPRQKDDLVLGAMRNKSEYNNSTNNILDSLNDDSKSLLNKSLTAGQNTVGQIAGATTEIATSIASKSAEAVTDFIFDNTVGNVDKQIDKLPQKEQEKIRDELCK